MELLRLGALGEEKPAVRGSDGIIRELCSVTSDINGDFFASGGIRRTREALQHGLPEWKGAENMRVGAPIARPSAILCIGQNYAAHAAESGNEPPSTPIVFFKHPNTLVGAFDDVQIPPGAKKVDWEVELAVVIGQRASYLKTPDEALKFVAGYAISNDVSERAYQLDESGGQWSKGKSCPTFNPLGPFLLPADEIDNPQQLRLWSKVNGDNRQDSNTEDMIFSVDYLIWHLSQYVALEPGDLINTGTPKGVALSGRFPYLRSGDTMTLGIEKLGIQKQTLR